MMSSSSKDLVISAVVALSTLMLAAYMDANEKFIEWAEQYEEFEVDELPVAAAAVAICLAWFAWRRWRELNEAQSALKLRLQQIEALSIAEQRGKESAIEKSQQLSLVGEMTEALLISSTRDEALRVFNSYACQLSQSNAGAVILRTEQGCDPIVTQWGDLSGRFGLLDFTSCWSHRSNKVYDTEMGFCERSCGCKAPRQLCMPVTNGADCHGVISVELVGLREDEAAAVTQALMPAAGVLAITLSNLNLRENLFHQSIRDPLTGLLNRRGWQEKVKFVNADKRFESPFSIITVDIDDFKQINDQLGHESGDRALRILSETIGENTRSVDLVCRLGGDEVLMLLPEMDSQQSIDKVALIARIFKRKCQQQFNCNTLAFSLSSGIASYPEDGADVHELVAQSDNYLYSAKYQGKDCIASGLTKE
ncbi:GGDEF domain-containing protein [Motiliproteus coralliicola]|nr:GGDEF domain-containing protein [Motiliproteus coralliicola]